MSNGIHKASPDLERLLQSQPAVYANTFYLNADGRVARLTFADAAADGHGNTNINVRGSYILTIAHLLELRRLITHKIDEMTAEHPFKETPDGSD